MGLNHPNSKKKLLKIKDARVKITQMMGKPSTKDIPVVMMSADNEVQKIASCFGLGATTYMVKPIKLNQVKGLANYINESQEKRKARGGTANSDGIQ